MMETQPQAGPLASFDELAVLGSTGIAKLYIGKSKATGLWAWFFSGEHRRAFFWFPPEGKGEASKRATCILLALEHAGLARAELGEVTWFEEALGEAI